MKRLISLACLSMAIAGCGEVTGSTDQEERCGAGFLACGSQCIEPNRDPLFCGATDDCVGPNSGVACAVGDACVQGVCTADEPLKPVAECINCGFESGSLSSWTVRDILEPYHPLGVVGTGVNLRSDLFSSLPSEGSYALATGFDGTGPGVISAGQVINLPADAPAALSFDYRAGWNLTEFGATLPRTFLVAISTPEGLPLRTETILTAAANTSMRDTGLVQRSLNLESYAGQSVMIEFMWDVPEDSTGPSFFQLDNVQIIAK